jgi:hypothetical protein
LLGRPLSPLCWGMVLSASGDDHELALWVRHLGFETGCLFTRPQGVLPRRSPLRSCLLPSSNARSFHGLSHFSSPVTHSSCTQRALCSACSTSRSLSSRASLLSTRLQIRPVRVAALPSREANRQPSGPTEVDAWRLLLHSTIPTSLAPAPFPAPRTSPTEVEDEAHCTGSLLGLPNSHPCLPRGARDGSLWTPVGRASGRTRSFLPSFALRVGALVRVEGGHAQSCSFPCYPCLGGILQEVRSSRSRCDEKLVRSRQRAVRGRAVRDCVLREQQ